MVPETMIEYVCGYCGRLLHIPGKYAGSRGTCNRCGNRIAVPPEKRLGPPPQTDNFDDLRGWVDAQVVGGIPCEVVLHHLDGAGRGEMSEGQVEALKRVQKLRVEEARSRFEHARQLEAEGRTDEAIRLYERQVYEGDLSGITHERLRKIYLDRNDLSNALRVCLACLTGANFALANGWVTDAVSRDDLIRLATAFQRHVHELRERRRRP